MAPYRVRTADLPADTQAALADHWNVLIDCERAMGEWLKANPRPDVDLDNPGPYAQWRSARDAEVRRLGRGLREKFWIHYSDNGFRRMRAQPLWACILPEPLTHLAGIPSGLTRLAQCDHCSALYITCRTGFAPRHCCTACDAAVGQALVDQRKARSEALANRTGLCYVCGESFRVRRSTARTCSERCRKRAQRHPEQYVSHGSALWLAEHPEALRG